MSARELYFISGSPPCWSVMLALAVKGLGYTRRRLSTSAGDQKTPEYRKINPRGHVPVLVDDDTVEKVVAAIVQAAKTGKIGDGKVFVLQAESAIRIRTEETNGEAL
mgnify:CR=1 FL=1